MLLLTVFGSVLIVTGIGLIIRHRSHPDDARVRTEKLEIPVTVVLLLLGVVLVVLGVFGTSILPWNMPVAAGPIPTAVPSSPTTSEIPKPTEDPTTMVSIDQPAADALVTGNGFPVSGHSSLRPENVLWPMYRGISNGNSSFQPQNGPCPIAIDGSFTCPDMYVGGVSDACQTFELLIVLADKAAVAEFMAYEKSDPEKRGYPGLTSIPSGAKTVASTTVMREPIPGTACEER